MDSTLSLITERASQPWGLAGGGPGAVGENWLLPGGDESRAERLPDKCTVELKAGDVVRMLTPGGGGWGEPAEVPARLLSPRGIVGHTVKGFIAGEGNEACRDHRPTTRSSNSFSRARRLQVRLDRSCKFKCSECRKTKAARLVALVDDDWERLVCNGCYGQLRAEGRLPRLANRGVPAGGDPVEPEVASRDRTEGRRAQEASAPAAVPQTRGPVDGATVSIVEVEAKYAATPFHVAEANEREAERREANWWSGL